MRETSLATLGFSATFSAFTGILPRCQQWWQQESCLLLQLHALLHQLHLLMHAPWHSMMLGLAMETQWATHALFAGW